jgi:hypothetical protein
MKSAEYYGVVPDLDPIVCRFAHETTQGGRSPANNTWEWQPLVG